MNTTSTLSPLQNKIMGISEHDLRLNLHGELRVGRCELLAAQTQVSHLALLSDSDSVDKERQLLTQLCERYDVTPPKVHASSFCATMGTFRLKWERHNEYSTYTVYHAAPFETPFAEPAISLVPQEWLARLPGSIIAALHIALDHKERPQRKQDKLALLFSSNTIIGSEVVAGRAVAWTDNQIHADGFSRILIHDVDLNRRQAGRLVQRLMDIETYRILAMLALPLARKYIPELARFDTRLAGLTTDNIKLESLEDEQHLLDKLTKLSAEIEQISAHTNHRFSASLAYYAIVKRRVSELREKRIQGMQTFQEFLEQRLAPAMASCASVHNKLETLSTRVGRTSALLRTRVDITMEGQSRDLLRSMDRRAHMQLRLQETVEGLSIVVLSYYLVGLVGYALKAGKAAGLGINVELGTGIAIPVVLALVFLAMRRLRKMVGHDKN